jgi:hypothetical protein
MISWTYKLVDTGEKRDALGLNPRGSDRVIVFVFRSDRTRPLGLPPLDDEKIALFDSMFAYSGTYTIQPDRVIHHVDMSWNDTRSGTDQCGFARLKETF